MGDQIRMQWIGHNDTILSSFYKLLTSQSLVDVTLACEGKYIRAHQLILSSCSPYFQALLSIDTTKHPILFLKDVKFTELEAIIQYIYRGEVVLAQEDFPSFLSVAKALKINGVGNDQTETNTTTSDPIIHNDQAGISRDTMAPPPPPILDVAPPSHMVHTPTTCSNVGVPGPFQQQQAQMSLVSPTAAHIAPVLDSASLMSDMETFGTGVTKLEGVGPIAQSFLVEEENAGRQAGSSESWQMDYADDSEMLHDDYDEELPVRYGNNYSTVAEGGEGHPNLIIRTMTSPVDAAEDEVLDFPVTYQAKATATTSRHHLPPSDSVETTRCQCRAFNHEEIVVGMRSAEPVEQKVTKYSLVPLSAAAGQGNSEENPIVIDGDFRVPLGNTSGSQHTSWGSCKRYRSAVREVEVGEAHTERDVNGPKEVTGKRPTKYTKIMTRSISASPWAGKARQQRASVAPKKCPCCQDEPQHKHH